MAIIRWNPFNLSSLLEDDFDLPTMPGLSRLNQGLSLYQTKDSFIAEAALPGINEDQIDVTAENGVVRISASSQDEQKNDRSYFIRSVSNFNYTFRLPDGVLENEEPKAELQNGMLKLTFPKLQPVPPKKIKVVKSKDKETKTDGKL